MRKLLSAATCASLLVQSIAPSAFAAGSPAGSQAHFTIPKAIGVFMTNRGQEYFERNLKDYVFRSGYSLDEGGFDGWNYEAAEALKLDELPVRFQGFHSTLGAIRDILKRWMLGFSFNDPRLGVEVKDIMFEASFNKLGLKIDREATYRIPEGRGLVAVFEAEIPHIRVEAATVRARDLSNPFLGTFGVNHLWTGIHENSEPLRFSVPVSLTIDETNNIQVHVNEITNNLSAVTMDLGFDRPMMLPRVEVILNGRVMPLNQRRLEDALLAHKVQLLKALQTYLEEHAISKVPEALNAMIAEKLKTPFTDVNEMDPPGYPTKPVPAAEKFQFGVTPEEIRVSRDFMHFGLSAFVNDPKARDNSQAVSSRRTWSPPLLNLYNPQNYDVALSINQDMINRLLGLSFRRGYFDRIEAGSSVMRLVRAPELRVDRTTARDRATLHLRASQEVSGIQSLIVSSPLEFEIDVDLRLVKTPDGALSVALSRVDERSLQIESRYIKVDLFRGKVFRAVRDKLRAANAQLAQHEKVLVEKLPIPAQIAGLPIKVKDFQSDGNGYLVLYLEYNFARR